ncbi:MAG: DUF7948 domain-containing protein [Bacteroidia bacterium]
MKAFFAYSIYGNTLKYSYLTRLLLTVLFAIFYVNVQAQIKIIPNAGQWPQRVLYKADIPGGIFYIEKDTLTYYFYDAAALHDAMHDHKEVKYINGHVLRVGFPGSKGVKKVFSTGKPTSEYYNYFIGNDSSKWAGNLHAVENVILEDVWKGIDLEITYRGESIKYNFIVHPKADASQVKVQYFGGDKMQLGNGELKVSTSLGELTEKKPFVYQENSTRNKNSNPESSYAEIETSFTLQNNILGFNLGRYNKREKLIIDPIIVFSTFSGSVADNFGFTGTYNTQGNAYSGGTVYSVGFPTTPGAFQTVYRGGVGIKDDNEIARDAGILKYSPDGKQLLWATYLGGSHNEQPHSMVVNKRGDLVILGTTHSYNFPMAGNGFDQSYNGEGDIYVCRLSEDGSRLLSSTFVGGSRRDGLNGYASSDKKISPLRYNYGDQYRGEVIVDNDDNVLIATNTQSFDFPVFGNSFQTGYGGEQDGCIVKLNPDLENIQWSAFIGGNEADATYGINIDRSGNIVVCGGTQSSNFYTSSNAMFQNLLGDRDGYVTKISPDGKAVLSSTFIGTSNYDQAYFVQIDDANRIYVTGQTLGNFPVSENVFNNNNGSQFIAVLENDLSAFYLSTVFGSGRATTDLSPSAFLVDLCGRIYVSGWGGEANSVEYGGHGGNTRNLTTTADAFQTSTDGSDFYLIILARDLRNIVYGSYFGGPKSAEHVDGGTSRFDRDGIVYQSVCGGCGGYSDFPTTEGAWSNKNYGRRPNQLPVERSLGCNNAIFKIDLNSSNYPPEFKDTTIILTAIDSLEYNFDIIDYDKGDSIYARAESRIFDGKLMPLPVATFNIKPGINKISGTLQWQTGCEHISTDTYFVYIYMRDNGCPTPRTSIGVIKIVVKAPPIPAPPAMFCLNRINEYTLNLTWNEYETNKYLKHFTLVKHWPDGKVEKVKTFNSQTDNSYTDFNAPDHLTKDYCYYIYGTSICDTEGDTTRTICSIPDEDSIPKAVYMYTVSVENNKNLRVIWNKYQKDDFYIYDLYKKENGGKKDYKLYKSFRGQNDTTFLDSAVNVHALSYCYKVLVRNQCGLESRDSSYGCSILLKGISVPFEHQLSWNPYQKWKGDVERYELLRRDPSRPDSLVGTVNGNLQKFTDDKLDYDWGIYWYKVTGFEGIGGKGAHSVSNEIELIQAPIVYVPNGFTPNGDGINDSFNIVPVFVKDYHVKIYNRWGEFVWESHNKKFLWNAVYRNHDPFDNVFIWQIDYTGWDGSKHYKHGNVTVLW